MLHDILLYGGSLLLAGLLVSLPHLWSNLEKQFNHD